MGRPAGERQEWRERVRDLEKKAEAYAKEHAEQPTRGINEVAGIAESDTNHQHDEQTPRERP